MIIPDINLLLYAYNPHVPQHEAARNWWEGVLNGDELIGMPYEVAFGFIRIATHPRLGTATVPLRQARALVESWLRQPHLRLLIPGDRHFEKVLDLMTSAHASGAVLSDAILAAFAIANRATLHTNDSDFARFPSLQWRNPLIVR